MLPILSLYPHSISRNFHSTTLRSRCFHCVSDDNLYIKKVNITMADSEVQLLNNTSKPRCVLLISGKRKSGKDYIVGILLQRLKANDAVVVRLSAPIKKYWSESQGLNFDELLGTGTYKENHRLEMIRWGESVRAKDPGYFCKRAIEMSNANQHTVWIISDARRRSDLKWFLENYGHSALRTVRIVASDEVRKQRGWTFTPGVDDAESECDLDSVTNWDWTIPNNDDEVEALEAALQNIVQWVKSVALCG